jgi:hypothetical protein
MHAFDTADSPGRMVLTVAESGLLLLQGVGVRSWLRPAAGPTHMTTRWEREVDGAWRTGWTCGSTAPEPMAVGGRAAFGSAVRPMAG